jgi:hypothetical protein
VQYLERIKLTKGKKRDFLGRRPASPLSESLTGAPTAYLKFGKGCWVEAIGLKGSWSGTGAPPSASS